MGKSSLTLWFSLFPRFTTQIKEANMLQWFSEANWRNTGFNPLKKVSGFKIHKDCRFWSLTPCSYLLKKEYGYSLRQIVEGMGVDFSAVGNRW
jgi:hypothetical protein